MEFEASLVHLDDMLGYIRSRAKECGISIPIIQKIELPCEEALVNVISYAYPRKKGKLFIICEKNQHHFEVIIKDHGKPFNPIDADVNPQIDEPVQDRKIGGLGIYLIRKAIDEASYQRIGAENVLRMVFQFD